jgi:hypothetical protein
MLVKVWTELPSGKNKSLLAKVIETKGPIMTIQYLSATDDKDHGRVLYKYEEQTYDVEDDSITEYIGDTDETDIGFLKVNEGFVKYESDSDYVPSEEDSESDVEDDDDIMDDESDYSLDEE